MCAGVGSGGEFRRCQRFRRVPVRAGVCCGGKLEGSGGFRRVPAWAGVGSGGRVRKVPESFGVVCCLVTLTGAAM